MKSFLELLDYQYTPLDKMTLEELKEELDTFRKLWTWLPENVRYWLCHVGYPIRVVARNMEHYVGTVATPSFELSAVDVDCLRERRDYLKRLVTTEVETAHIPMGSIFALEFIHSKEVMPLVEEPLDKAAEILEEG